MYREQAWLRARHPVYRRDNVRDDSRAICRFIARLIAKAFPASRYSADYRPANHINMHHIVEETFNQCNIYQTRSIELSLMNRSFQIDSKLYQK